MRLEKKVFFFFLETAPHLVLSGIADRNGTELQYQPQPTDKSGAVYWNQAAMFFRSYTTTFKHEPN